MLTEGSFINSGCIYRMFIATRTLGTRFCEVCEQEVPTSSVYLWKDNPEDDPSKPYLYKCKDQCLTIKKVKKIDFQNGYSIKIQSAKHQGFGRKKYISYLRDGMVMFRGVFSVTNKTLKILLDQGVDIEGEIEEEEEDFENLGLKEEVNKNFTYDKEELLEMELDSVTLAYTEFEGRKFYGCSFFYKGFHYEEIMPESNIEFLRRKKLN